MEASRSGGIGAGDLSRAGFRLGAVALGVAMALGLSACGGGGGGGGNGNVKPTQPTPPSTGGTVTPAGQIDVDAGVARVVSDNLSGSIDLIKGGAGTLTLTGNNSYAGSTKAQAGSLYVDGDQSNAKGETSVAGGATLGGKGIVGGNVTVADGGRLAPGSHAAVGTLRINGSLVLSSGSTLAYDFSAPDGSGNARNDFIDIGSNVTLDGKLDVSTLTGGLAMPGVYRLLNYGGTLVDHGLDTPNGLLVQTGVAHQVNLVNTQGMRFSFWDGNAGPQNDHVVNGGNGTWQADGAGAMSNWTDANGAVNVAFGSGSFAVFQGTPGTVAVDGSKGDITVSGMQFASDGYVVQGDTIRLAGGASDSAHSVIRVGDGSSSESGYTATIDSDLAGSAGLVKVGAGTLILGGANTYTGGTTINGGVLQIGNGGTRGSIVGDVINEGILAFNRSGNVGFDGVVSGSGSLRKIGAGTLMLTGNNTYTGGTLIAGGTLQLGNNSNAGWVAGNITNNGTLLVYRADDVTFSGLMTGTGALQTSGHNTLTVTGSLQNTGGTIIDGGSTLQVGDGGILGSLFGNVVDYGTLAFNRTDDQTFGGNVSGSGKLVKLGGNTLTLTGTNGATGDAGLAFGTTVVDGTLRLARGASLVYATSVGGNLAHATLRVDQGATVGRMTLEDGATLDNAGLVHYDTPFTVVSGGAATVSNHNGGVIETVPQTGYVGAAVSLGANSTLTNGPGSIIRGAMAVQSAGVVNNDGGTISGLTDDGVNGDMVVVNNMHGGTIASGLTPPFNFLLSSGVFASGTNATINNLSGSSILGKRVGVDLEDGGTVNNDGGSIVTGTTGVTAFSRGSTIVTVNNSNGARITGTQTGIRLGYGGVINNGVGSTIETTSPSAGDCAVTPACAIYVPVYSAIGSYGSIGVLTLSNAGNIVGDVQMDPGRVNDITLVAGGSIQGALKIGSNAQSTLTLDGDAGTTQLYSNAVTGTTTFGGKLAKSGSGTWVLDNTALQGVVDTTIEAGSLRASQALSGNVAVHAEGTLDGVPGVIGNLANAGRTAVHGGDSAVGGNYSQTATGTLAVSLGSKLVVGGAATLGGALEVTGADSGYVSNTHTEVLTASNGVTGTFDRLVKDTGVVFTTTTIQYDANSVWLDTTGLNITTAFAKQGGTFTAATLGGALRVQGAFDTLDNKIASGTVSEVSETFVAAAGQFQQAPTIEAAQTSLQTLSGQLHAASAAMTFEAIDASSRALADHFDDLLDAPATYGMWTHDLSRGGNMGRAGFDGVGFQLNGWMIGNDRPIGSTGVAGFAFGQSQGQQRLDGSADRNRSRNTEGMVYAGALNGNWYARGRMGWGRFEQDVNRQLLLGMSAQPVGTRYGGEYGIAFGEMGLNMNWAGSRVTPFVNLEYANIRREGFAEQGAGGFGLQANTQILDRWQAGVGLRASRRWLFGGGRALDFRLGAQFQRTLSSHGDVFDASFVGLQQWQPLIGVGLSRYRGLLNMGLKADLSARTSLDFSYDYQTGQHDQSKVMSARFVKVF
ncbi:autotransporter domain-containing protein [Luteibacter jiangsuensis]|uniref:Autotransporter domain-containing protein n=1 Tax=Luteibacter jiangsuensis TaxID=637577 RepID=A0ABX0PY09_9GAMM|nr:autotransporter domain-containing protein [Luteibacter jiangsuensis]NID03319.1 autotransporter domain-containing protein [Luteibacter jiangsuensis]